MGTRSIVALRECRFDLEEEQIEEEVSKVIDMLGGIPSSLETAESILVKPNIGFTDVRFHKGRMVSLTEPSVVRSVLRRIREVNDCEIIIADGPPYGKFLPLVHDSGYFDIIEEFEVNLIEASQRPFKEVDVPGGGTILNRYTLNEKIAQVDATVSISKMKVHVFQGVSLCMKNLFGVTPGPVYGYPRYYLHYPFRLPRCLVDLTAIFKPSLSIIDGIIGEDIVEWGGPPVESNMLIAGDNAVATDAIGTVCMGFDPTKDFPENPFNYDISHINLAKMKGLGTNEPTEIDILGDLALLDSNNGKYHKQLAVGQPPEAHLESRRYLIKQAEHYRRLLPRLLKKSKGHNVGILDGKVIFSAPNVKRLRKEYDSYFVNNMTYTTETGGTKLPFLKKVFPPEEDPEVKGVFT